MINWKNASVCVHTRTRVAFARERGDAHRVARACWLSSKIARECVSDPGIAKSGNAPTVSDGTNPYSMYAIVLNKYL